MQQYESIPTYNLLIEYSVSTDRHCLDFVSDLIVENFRVTTHSRNEPEQTGRDRIIIY